MATLEEEIMKLEEQQRAMLSPTETSVDTTQMQAITADQQRIWENRFDEQQELEQEERTRIEPVAEQIIEEEESND